MGLDVALVFSKVLVPSKLDGLDVGDLELDALGLDGLGVDGLGVDGLDWTVSG